jgi:glycosyltransferase involved in cell wall biosynthesis
MTDSGQKPHIAIVCDTVPYPTRSGDNQRIAELISVLRGNGWFVHLVLSALVDEPFRTMCHERVDALHLYSGQGLKTRSRNILRRTVRLFDRMGKRIGLPPAEDMASRILGKRIAPLVLDYWQRYPEGLDKHIAQLATHYPWRAIIVEYLWLYRAARALPNEILKLLDTHDLQFKRVEEFASRGIIFPLSVTREEEARIFNEFDAVIAIQSGEAALIREMCADVDVLTVGSTGAALRELPNCPVSGRVLYVGGYNGANIDGLRRFLTVIWPQVCGQQERAQLHVCGYIYRAFLGQNFERVSFRGHLEDLEPEYSAAAVVINPCWIGTGLKIKTVDALARGKPLVTTNKGIEGLHGDVEKACLICNQDDDFAHKVADLLASWDKADQLSKRAKYFAETHLTTPSVYRELLDFLNKRR